MTKEVWCMAKNRENQGGKNWQGPCQKCCIFCPDNKTCEGVVCVLGQSPEKLCCWMASPSEWMMGQISDDAKKETYYRRRLEHMIREGYVAGDGSWEGNRLADFQKKDDLAYKRLLYEFQKKRRI